MTAFSPRLIVSRQGIVHIYSSSSEGLSAATLQGTPLPPSVSSPTPGTPQSDDRPPAESEHGGNDGIGPGQTFDQVWADLTQHVVHEAGGTHGGSMPLQDGSPAHLPDGPHIISRRPRFDPLGSPPPPPPSSVPPTLPFPDLPFWSGPFAMRATGTSSGIRGGLAAGLLSGGSSSNILPGIGLPPSWRHLIQNTPQWRDFQSPPPFLYPPDAPEAPELPPLERSATTAPLTEDDDPHAVRKRLTAMLRTCKSPRVMIDVLRDYEEHLDAVHLSVAINRYADLAARGHALPKPEVNRVLCG